MFEQLESIIKLNANEEQEFARFIKDTRSQMISTPEETTTKAMNANKDEIELLLKNNNISEAITNLRQISYDQFLIEESSFNGVVLTKIGSKFNAPKYILRSISQSLFNLRNVSLEIFQEEVGKMFGSFAGSISPYIYQLCLSNTQSRRSRAGKVFEGIIYFLYKYFGFAYESQSSIGRKAFSDLNLGKVVDSILPSTVAFKEFRNKTIVGSMKTTLRERWQEVVEEISRSNLPNIYLLTVDDNISESKVQQMSEHNIVLVVTNTIKRQEKLKNKRNVIDFERYFIQEIPEIMSYWDKSDND